MPWYRAITESSSPGEPIPTVGSPGLWEVAQPG